MIPREGHVWVCGVHCGGVGRQRKGKQVPINIAEIECPGGAEQLQEIG